MRKQISKLLISLTIFCAFAWAGQAQAQCYGSGCWAGGGGYYNNVTNVLGLNPYYWPRSYVVAYSIYQAFGALQEGLYLLEQGKEMENAINVRRNNLENYKSLQRYYTEGIPPFAPIAPNGKPRSPKITFADVESIGLTPAPKRKPITGNDVHSIGLTRPNN